MNLENFGRKIKAKVHEKIETSKAEGMMMRSQSWATYQRERYNQELKKSKFDGKILKVTRTLIIEGGGTGYQYELEIQQDSHEILCSFVERYHDMRGDYYTDLEVSIDGKSLSEEAARLYIEPQLELFKIAGDVSEAVEEAKDSPRKEFESQNKVRAKEQEKQQMNDMIAINQEKVEAEKRAKIKEAQQEIDELLK